MARTVSGLLLLQQSLAPLEFFKFQRKNDGSTYVKNAYWNTGRTAISPQSKYTIIMYYWP